MINNNNISNDYDNANNDNNNDSINHDYDNTNDNSVSERKDRRSKKQRLTSSCFLVTSL